MRVLDVARTFSPQAMAETKLDDLGLDSLDFLQLIVDLDKEFDIKLDIESAALCQTVGDLAKLVESTC